MEPKANKVFNKLLGKEDYWQKCSLCGRRFKVQNWKVGRETEICFSCQLLEGYVKAVEQAMNSKQKMEGKREVELNWKFKKL